MSADRTEKLTITRSHRETLVKVALVEDGITVNYTVKTWESQVANGVDEARKGAERMLERVRR